MLKSEKGITMVSLITTIVVMILISGVALKATVGREGLVQKGIDAKNLSDEYDEKEKIQTSITQASIADSNGDISLDTLKKYLKENFGDEDATTVTKQGNDIFLIHSNISGMDYNASNENNITKIEYIPPEETTPPEEVYSGDDIGAFVEYDVSYKDMYSDYEFTKDDGWRILSSIPNSSGRYNIKLISTGIPMLLNYDSIYSDHNGWYGTQEQVSNYCGNEYSNATFSNGSLVSATYLSAFVSTGLTKNFKNIELRNEISNPTQPLNNYNMGSYKSIKGISNSDINCSIFALNSGYNVHALTLEELNEARLLTKTSLLRVDKGETNQNEKDGALGLFFLKDLVNVDESYGYKTITNSTYYLGTMKLKDSVDNYFDYIYFITNDGEINGSNNSKYGIRPVIEINNVQLVKTDEKVTKNNEYINIYKIS